MDARLQALRTLAQNPAANPVATAIAVAILALALLLVIVGLLAWALPASTRPVTKKRRRSQKPATTGGRRVARSGAALTAVVSVAAVLLGYVTTSQDSFCTSVCHATAASSDTWRDSAHSDVSCIRCHEGVPVLSAVPAAFSRLYSTYAESAKREGGHVSAVPSARCLDCHIAIAKGITLSTKGLAMRHSDVIAAGAACDDCHGAQGHQPAGQSPPMSACLRCHDGRTAPIDCDTCHRRSADALIRPRDTRFGKVNLPDRPTCGGCHSETACDACHGLRMPHPDGYQDPRMHASDAAFDRKDRLCYRCHVFADCGNCHLSFDAHVANWKEVHKQYPRDTIYCLGCHKTADMCGLCHTE